MENTRPNPPMSYTSWLTTWVDIKDRLTDHPAVVFQDHRHGEEPLVQEVLITDIRAYALSELLEALQPVVDDPTQILHISQTLQRGQGVYSTGGGEPVGIVLMRNLFKILR